MSRSQMTRETLDEYTQDFLRYGGEIKTVPPANVVWENDGETWQQQNRRRWAARQEREAQNGG